MNALTTIKMVAGAGVVVGLAVAAAVAATMAGLPWWVGTCLGSAAASGLLVLTDDE